jgi:hypothetical protein
LLPTMSTDIDMKQVEELRGFLNGQQWPENKKILDELVQIAVIQRNSKRYDSAVARVCGALIPRLVDSNRMLGYPCLFTVETFGDDVINYVMVVEITKAITETVAEEAAKAENA